MGVGQLSESDAVDALRLPFYSSSHPTGSHGCRNQFDLGNPRLNQPSAGWAEEPWGPNRGPTDEFLLAFGRTKHSGKGRLSSFLSAT